MIRCINAKLNKPPRLSVKSEGHGPLLQSARPLDETAFSEGDRKRFLSRVETRGHDECWEWKGYRDKNGYGALYINESNHRSHRVALAISGVAIPSGMCVCHTCDNPPCCNPAHLFLGTNLDNRRDMIKKGRGSSGDSHWTQTMPHIIPRGRQHWSTRIPESICRGTDQACHKLTDDAVRFIRSSPLPRLLLAHMFGISRRRICAVQLGKAWKHVR